MKRYVFLASICALFWLYLNVSYLAGWDEGFYWAQLTSVFYDRDLTLHDDLLANHNSLETQHRSITFVNETGGLPNSFSVGTVVCDGAYAGPMVLLERLTGSPRITSGLIRGVSLFAILKICLLLLALEWLVRRYSTGGRPVFLSVLAVFIGTPVFIYALRTYAMSHLNSALLATLFVAALIVWLRDPDTLVSLTLGLVAGLMIVTRWQNTIYVLLVIPPLWHRLRQANAKERVDYVKNAALVALLAMAVASIQFVAWHKQFGTLLHMPQGRGYMHWASPRWVPLLFSGYHGLLPWSPVMAISVVGMIKGIVIARGNWRWFMVGGVLTFLAAVYVNACPADWWGGWSYGARRFCCLIPLCALGTFEMFRSLDRRLSLLLFVLVLGWAHFTSTCFENRVDDLCVPLCGQRSQAAGEIEDDYWITEPDAARAAIRERIDNVGYPPRMLVGLKDMDALDRILSLGIIVGILCVANGFLTRYRRSRRFRRITLSVMAGYIAVLVLLMFTLPDSSRLNAPWKRYLEGEVSAEDAKTAGIPQEPIRLIEALTYLSEGDTNGAKMVLGEIAPGHFPGLRIENVMALER